MATPADERVTVGLVHGLHGLRGAVRVEVLSDDPDRFAVGSVVFAEGDARALTIDWTGPARLGLLVSFSELPSRESAEHLRGRYLEAEPGEPLPEGSYYWHQVQGLEVVTTAGDALGKVADVFRAGGGEVYVVQGGPLGEILVPGTRDVVVDFDPPAGRFVIDPVALDLPDKPPRRRRRHELTRRDRKAAKAARSSRKAKAGAPASEAVPEEPAGSQDPA